MVHQDTIGVLNTGNNLNFTTNNFSNGTNHNGCIRNIVIANDTTLGPLGGTIGTSYCGPVVPNTSGGPAVLTGSGSALVANNNLTLIAEDMPANQFGFFLTSQTQGFVTNPGGSNGNLCLGGTIGRYVGMGQIKNAGAGGTFDLLLNLAQTPAGPVFVSIAAGQTWNFQAWFRDIGPMGQPQSNFTNGLAVTFM